MQDYIALSMMAIIVGGLVGVIIWISQILGPKSTSAIKEEPYEAGVKPFRVMRGHVPVKFYLVALLFVVFDVELTFLFPWAIVFRELGWMAFVSMVLFLSLLFLTLIYAWKKGVLAWK
jgi:NADH-quinone oxidoreductase subunit A